MRLWMIETDHEGLTMMNWFKTREEAMGFLFPPDGSLPDVSNVIEVEKPGCETLVGGSRMVQASECGEPAVDLVEGAPICRQHLDEVTLLDYDYEQFPPKGEEDGDD